MAFEAFHGDIDTKAFWRALGARAVGATVITTGTGPDCAGFLGLSFAHVSADPPLVLISASKTTRALATILEQDIFAVNLLSAGSEPTARAFGGALASNERFALDRWGAFVTGAPVLENAAAVFDCRVGGTMETGAATVILGQVVGLRISETADILLAWQGEYCDLPAGDLPNPSGAGAGAGRQA